MECLYVNFDFDSAQKKLRECESVSNLSNIDFNQLVFTVFFFYKQRLFDIFQFVSQPFELSYVV